MYQPPLRGRPALVSKKVLLVDPYQPTRDARSSFLREYDIELDVAESLETARLLWRPRIYAWTLLDVKRCVAEDALAFYEEIRDAGPRAHVAFLVGPPRYLSLTWPGNITSEGASSSHWTETVYRFVAAA